MSCVPMDGEPSFTLLGRDPQAPFIVRDWARVRRQRVSLGLSPPSDLDKCEDAERLADQMELWRAKNDGAWRRQNPELPFEDATQRQAAIYNGDV